MIKGGAYPVTIQGVINALMVKGLSVEEAIKEVESTLHILYHNEGWEDLKDRIRQECKGG